jgi:hypothetical protein
MTADAPIVARRPSARQPLGPTEAAAELTKAHEHFIACETAYNDATHARARAISVAHFRDGLTWQQCAEACDLRHGTTAQNIVTRFTEATLEGRTLQPAGAAARRWKEQDGR